MKIFGFFSILQGRCQAVVAASPQPVTEEIGTMKLY